MILVKLLLAHLIGDFLLQPDSWVADKEQKKIRSGKLIFHGLIHFGLMWLFLWSVHLWWLILVVTVLHLATDLIKLYFQREATRRKWFFIDQVAHIVVLAGASALINKDQLFMTTILSWLSNEAFWVILTAVIFLSLPSAVIIKMSISRWAVAIPKNGSVESDSLASAGKIIGVLERMFVFVLVMVGQWQAVGFLLAAKSVFRFGDLREIRDRKLTEYVLIGTLMSFGIALLTGLGVSHILRGF